MQFRYDYWFDAKRLILRFPSRPHELAVDCFSESFTVSVIQLRSLTPEPIGWHKGTGLDVEILGPPGYDDVKFKPDWALCDNAMNALILIEVSLAQTKSDAEKKILDRISRSPWLVGGIVVNFIEDPKFAGPKHVPVPDDDLNIKTSDDWSAAVASQPELGPIYLKGHRWCGRMTYEIDVYLATGPFGQRLTKKTCQVRNFSNLGSALMPHVI